MKTLITKGLVVKSCNPAKYGSNSFYFIDNSFHKYYVVLKQKEIMKERHESLPS